MRCSMGKVNNQTHPPTNPPEFKNRASGGKRVNHPYNKKRRNAKQKHRGRQCLEIILTKLQPCTFHSL